MTSRLTTARYFTELKRELKAVSDAETAARMSRYLRDRFACIGVKTPERRLIQKKFRELHGELTSDELGAFIALCWKDSCRELQYTGIDHAIGLSKKAPEDAWVLYESMITEKSWWDSVDPVATTLMTQHLQRHERLNPLLPDRWIKSDNIWLQRTALLFQLKYKTQTNANQLFGYIDVVRESEEFFVQKAAGWALREYSRHDPKAVCHYVRNTHLPALTVREGLRLMKIGTVTQPRH